MRTLSAKAYAKINLYLDVVGKRSDGYHNIKSIMQQVSLCDTVTVTRTEAPDGIVITCTDPAVPTDGRNIVYKCAARFFEYFGISERNIRIHIEKNIPACGGLAGGSTDGAAVLKLLNELYNTHADTETLCAIGVKVGADIPFCVVGGTCICEGIGEILTPLSAPKPDYHVLISFPGNGISTPEAYALLDSIEILQDHPPAEDVIASLEKGETPKNMYNAFEYAVLPTHENARLLKQAMLDNGAVSAMMSGSGSTIFGLFDSGSSASACQTSLDKSGFSSHICVPIN